MDNPSNLDRDLVLWALRSDQFHTATLSVLADQSLEASRRQRRRHCEGSTELGPPDMEPDEGRKVARIAALIDADKSASLAGAGKQPRPVLERHDSDALRAVREQHQVDAIERRLAVEKRLQGGGERSTANSGQNGRARSRRVR
jgi:hypothetical protein